MRAIFWDAVAERSGDTTLNYSTINDTKSKAVSPLRSATALQTVVLVALLAFCCCRAFAAETIPPAPTRYFNDYTRTVSSQRAAALNAKLEEFEKQTSSQVVVAMFSRMQSDSSIEDYANRVFRAWKIGQSQTNNGVLLLVFKDDRKLRIEVGYGLEGALPDALAKRIIDQEIVPHFKRGDYEAGLTAGVNAILAAIRGEYKGSGTTVAQRRGRGGDSLLVVLFPLFFFMLFAFIMFRAFRRSTVYHRRRRTLWQPIWGGGGWSSGSGWGSGGGGGWSAGGGFSGGGGSSGGGGASGSW